MDFAVQPGPDRGADGLEPPETLLFSTFHPLGLGTSEGSAPALEGCRAASAGPQQGQLHPSSQREQAPSSQTPSASGARLPCLVPVSGEAAAALQASTQAWFEQTQASSILPDGQRPDWFHGFLSRRESEQLLQDKPLGCYLIRFSESTVGFVLSYRGWDRCRHYILDQLEDGHYVILGEDSAHARLQELLQHYTSAPIHPYYELLTMPCAWSDKKPVDSGIPAGAEAATLPHAALSPAYSVVHKQRQATSQGCSSPEAACPGPLLPAKATRVPRSPWTDTAPPTPPSAPEAKYQQLLRFHTYAEPREGPVPSERPVPPERRIYHEPDEPIPFYAVGRGSPQDLGPENIYSEVDIAQEVQLTTSTLPPGLSRPRTFLLPRRLHRSMSSQGSRCQQVPAAPRRDKGSSRPSSPVLQVLPSPQLEFDDPIYSRKVPIWSGTMHAMGQEGLENVYELLPGDRPLSPGTGGCKA